MARDCSAKCHVTAYVHAPQQLVRPQRVLSEHWHSGYVLGYAQG